MKKLSFNNIVFKYNEKAGNQTIPAFFLIFGKNFINNIDWNIHHNDGTQEIFKNDPDVHQINIHSAVDLNMINTSEMGKCTTTYGDQVKHCNIPVLLNGFSDNFLKEIKLPGKFF